MLVDPGLLQLPQSLGGQVLESDAVLPLTQPRWLCQDIERDAYFAFDRGQGLEFWQRRNVNMQHCPSRRPKRTDRRSTILEALVEFFKAGCA